MERHVLLTLKPENPLAFFPLLQRGFMVKTRFGCSIKAMLCEQHRVSPEYVEDRIKTVFLDGRPVDDIDSATVNDGSTLALSAAMPGLAGATMRRGGVLASFRDATTHRETGRFSRRGEGMVTIKLFNLLIGEMGPSFLEHGVWIEGERLAEFLRAQKSDFWKPCEAVKLDGNEIDLDYAPGVKWPDGTDLVLLEVHQRGKSDSRGGDSAGGRGGHSTCSRMV